MLLGGRKNRFKNPDVAGDVVTNVLGIWIEVGRFSGLRFLGFAVGIEEHGEQGGRVLPGVTPAPFGHPHQRAQRQSAGIDADNSGEVVDEGFEAHA